MCREQKLNSSQEPRRIRESLELRLIGTQVEEALADDRHATLMQHLDLTTAALEALIRYVQSLQVTQLAACRVLNISHLLLFPRPSSANYSDPEPTHLTTHLQRLETLKESGQVFLQDLVQYCEKHVTLPKQLCSLIDDHCVRKKDFYLATKNFKNLLGTSKLSVLQMEKLHRQYEAILNDYQESRHTVEFELPKVANIRLTAFRLGFEKITDFCNNPDNVNQFALLFKLISEKLYQDDPNAGRDQTFHDQTAPNSDVCQKCKVNRVDKK